MGWTGDNWNTTTDVSCSYVQGSSDSQSDKFSFVLTPTNLSVGGRVQFCVRFTSGGRDYWDSNGGCNYVFQVFNSSGTVPSVAPITSYNRYSTFGFMQMPRRYNNPSS